MNNRGVTLLYVLMALLAVSFMGLNLIKLTGADAKTGVYYGINEVSRLNNINGHTHATILIQSDTSTEMFDSIMVFLNEYMAAPSLDSITKRFIIGDSTQYVSMSNLPGAKYKVELTSFDPSSMVVQLTVDSKTKNTKTTNTGLYYLDGLEIHIDTVFDTVPDTSFVPMASFRLGGNTDFESNCNIIVDGGTFINGKLTTNSSDVIFNGPFHQAFGVHKTIINGGSLVFNDIAYLGGSWDFTIDVEFKKAVAFDGGLTGHQSNPEFNGTIYHNGRSTNAGWGPQKALHLDWAHKWNINNQKIYSTSGDFTNGETNGSYLDDICYNYSSTVHSSLTHNIDSAVGFDKMPPDLEIDFALLNSVTSYYTKSKDQGLSGASWINQQYVAAMANGDTLCGGFVVIREHPSWHSDGSAAVIEDDGVLLDGRIIYISTLNHDMSGFPSTRTDANVILLGRSSNSTCQLGFDYLRGILFIDGAGYQFQPSNPTVIDGATYYTPASRHYNNGGGSVHYKYNEEVLKETNCLGLITDPNDSIINEINSVVSIDKVLKLKPTFSHIETKLMSRVY